MCLLFESKHKKCEIESKINSSTVNTLFLKVVYLLSNWPCYVFKIALSMQYKMLIRIINLIVLQLM